MKEIRQKIPIKKLKKPTAVQTGKNNEQKTHRWLEERGWLVYTVPRTKFSSMDIYGCWDHIASFEDRTLFIQTKTNKKPGKEYMNKLLECRVAESFLFIWHDEKEEPEIIVINCTRPVKALESTEPKDFFKIWC